MAVVTMRQMLEAGVHFGHQTRRWNPKMKRFIFGERNGIYIIDLEQTLEPHRDGLRLRPRPRRRGGTVLFVGTKKQAQDPIRSYAEKCGMPYVNERWLGGMLTNFETISKRVGKMLEYERMQRLGRVRRDAEEGSAPARPRAREAAEEPRRHPRADQAPDAVFILDTKKEHIAVTEANKLGIPVIAVVDTNVDPDVVQYPIPGNDDAIRANALLARVIADAVEEGRYIAAKRNPAQRPGRRQRRGGGGVRRPAGRRPYAGRRRPGRARSPPRRRPPTPRRRRRAGRRSLWPRRRRRRARRAGRRGRRPTVAEPAAEPRSLPSRSRRRAARPSADAADDRADAPSRLDERRRPDRRARRPPHHRDTTES